MPQWRIVPAWLVAFLGFGRRYVADGLQEPSVVEPVDPFQRRELDGLQAAPWPAPVDQLGLVEAVDSFGESIVIGISDAADRRLHACFSQALGVFDRDVLAAPVAVCTSPPRWTGRRSCSACSSASSMKPACAVREARQPTILRA